MFDASAPNPKFALFCRESDCELRNLDTSFTAKPYPTYARHHLFAKWVVFVDPPRHSFWRRLMSKDFAAKVVADARLVLLRSSIAASMRPPPSARWNFICDFARPLPAIPMIDLLGVALRTTTT